MANFPLMSPNFPPIPKKSLQFFMDYGQLSYIFVGTYILFMSDSVAVVSLIRNMGSMDSLVHDGLAQEI